MSDALPLEAHPLDDRIAQVNQRLKAACLGFQIERRGQKLNLRGTLPPRPGSSRQRPHQQRLSLGLPATVSGLKQIEQTAKVVAAQLIQNTFDWQPYLGSGMGVCLYQATLPEQVDAFEMAFRSQGDRHPAAAQTTWEAAYAPYLHKLVAIAASKPNLTLPEWIHLTVMSTRAHSRSRQVCCTTMAAFASFLQVELPFDLKALWGNYGPQKTQFRDLPTDEQIVATFAQIPNPAWRFVYGLMATYGLRNHEVFFCDYSALTQGEASAVIQVLATTKTGHHEVWPFYPEWVEQFQLREGRLPAINTDLNQTTLRRIGQRVSAQFRRYGIPFSPYSLRHAWAIRTIHFGIPDTVAARMMGHSVRIHTQTYHRWITRRDQQRAVETALKGDRPVAPDVLFGSLEY